MVKRLIGIGLAILLLSGAKYMDDRHFYSLDQEAFRLHVIANSDDLNDQVLKLKVKDEIIKILGNDLNNYSDMRQARGYVIANEGRIKSGAEAVIAQQGYEYPVEIQIGEYDFPAKSYGNRLFPQGKYQALKVVIGSGQGKNWWCVLFPPLCVVSSSDAGLSLAGPEKAQVSFKCLELLPKGLKLQF
jgi:stage II sporulation protein R